MMTPLFLFVLAILSGMICTWLARQFALRYDIVNRPTGLVPQHVKPVAYLGGIGIYLGILIVVLIATYKSHNIPLSFLALSAGFLILGVVDDLTIFSAKVKFAIQIILATVCVISGVYFSFVGHEILDMIISAFWIIVLVNAFNLTDVCDGLVGGLSVVAGLMIYFHASGAGLLPLIVAGSTIGFLVFNKPMASIFMGDAGSHVLGFIFAYFTMTLPEGHSVLYDFLPLALICGVVLFELIFLIFIRTQKGLKWWKGSKDHFALRLQAQGKSKWTTDFIAWSLGVLCGLPLVLHFLGRTSYYYWISVALIFGVFLAFGLYLLRIEARQNSASTSN